VIEKWLEKSVALLNLVQIDHSHFDRSGGVEAATRIYRVVNFQM